MKVKQILCAVLAILMCIVPLSSCKKGSNDTDAATTVVIPPVTTPEDSRPVNVPDGPVDHYTVQDKGEWESLFGTLDWSNFTAEITGEAAGMTVTNYCYFSSLGAHYKTQDVEFYTVRTGDKFTTYEKDGSAFKKYEGDSSEKYDDAKAESVITVPLGSSFELFTYDSTLKAYTSDSTFKGSVDGGKYSYDVTDVVVVIKNSELTSVSFTLQINNTSAKLTYTELGTTIVTVPASVTENATPAVR